MGLSAKTAALTTSIFMALLAAVYFLFSSLIIHEFNKIERDRAAINYQRLSEAIAALEEDLLLRAQEWGNWDDSYAYIRKPTDSFIQANFEGLPFDFTDLFFINKQGVVVFSGRLDPDSKKFISVPNEVQDQIISTSKVKELVQGDSVDKLSGFVRTGSTASLISASSISDTSGAKASSGAIIFTKEFSKEVQNRLAKQIRMQPAFALVPINTPRSQLAELGSRVAVFKSESEISASGTIYDIEGAPLIAASLSMPREIYAQGKAALNNVLAVLFLFLLIANAITVIFLNHAVLAPLRSLADVMRLITTSGNLSLRINSTRPDEIGFVGKAFDSLLKNTEESYTEMLKAQRAMESANSGKSLFIAKVSHELRTPIHCITGMLRILHKQEPQAGKRQYIQMAQDSADGLLSTINEILDFSKIESGELALESYEFNLPNTIRACVQALIPRFEEKHGIELSWDVSPGIPENVIGDPHRLKNIFTNLLGNAYKFTDRGAVTFKALPYNCQREGCTGVRFEISDSGIGIPADKLASIFDPFTQADDSTARLYGGSGLGLAIVKQIVEQMGGKACVESVLGKGSTFSIEVPFETLGEAKTGPKNSSTSSRSVALIAKNSEATVLLVDGLRRYNIICEVFPPQDPQSFNMLSQDVTAYDLVINSGSIETIADELNPIIKNAYATKIPFIMSVPSCEMALTDRWERNKNYFLIQKPISALDVSLILEGRTIATIAHDCEEEIDAGASLHILIADDAPTNRIILSNLLEEAGHTVEVVDNGKKMLDKVRKSIKAMALGQRPFDIVMTDIQMPIMDGLTASQKIRESEAELKATKPVPIVAVTAYTFPGEAAKMRAAGIDHILTKPISPKKLAMLIAEISEQIGASVGVAAQETRQRDDQEDEQEDQEDRELIEELCRITERVSRVAASAHHQTIQKDDNQQEEKPTQETILEDTTIDIKDVFERSGNSLRRTNLILSGFLSAYPDPADWLENTALEGANPSDVRRATHSLKGLLLDVGAVSAARLAGDLEHQIATDPSCITSLEFNGLLCRVKTTASLLESLIEQLPKDEARIGTSNQPSLT
jgi:signal transduction histidine kinase/CheY-like chemotaxis protein